MNRARLLHFMLCFFQLTILSAMINPTENRTSGDTIQLVSEESVATIYVVKGTVITSDFENITTAKIVEVEKTDSKPVIVKENNNKQREIVKERLNYTKPLTKKEIYQPKSILKVIWYPIDIPHLTNKDGILHHGTLPVFSYSKVVLSKVKLLKIPVISIFQKAITSVVFNESIILEDFSQTSRVRPPPFTV